MMQSETKLLLAIPLRKLHGFHGVPLTPEAEVLEASKNDIREGMGE